MALLLGGMITFWELNNLPSRLWSKINIDFPKMVPRFG